MFINCNEFHSDLISLFEKLNKNIEIGNNEWHGDPFGEIETEPRNLREEVMVFFLKKNILIPNVAEKNILILVGVWQFL